MKISDSGNRRKFETGAVRDMAEGKGRCDLLPLGVIGAYMVDEVLIYLDYFVEKRGEAYLWRALERFCEIRGWKIEDALLEVSVHYEDGLKKYGERNWEKGIPLSSYIDSAVRHYLQYRLGMDEERHDRAFVWNILGALWTAENLPEMDDLPK